MLFHNREFTVICRIYHKVLTFFRAGKSGLKVSVFGVIYDAEG